MATPRGSLSQHQALASCGATLLAYVGVVHEVVGSTLYPDGPAAFGGPLGWHAAGISLIVVGLLIGAATLGLLRFPIVPLAALLSAAGCIALIGEWLQHGSFHFFAFTMVVAGAFVVIETRASGGR